MEDMLMHPTPLAVIDYVGPALAALVFVTVMSLVAEPARRTVNAIILAGASGVYLSGGFGLWELTGPVIGAAIGFRALRSWFESAVGEAGSPIAAAALSGLLFKRSQARVHRLPRRWLSTVVVKTPLAFERLHPC
jgi:hypothetical protein